MKITKSYLKQIIKEEMGRVVSEAMRAFPLATDVKQEGSDIKVTFKVRGTPIIIKYNGRGSPIVSKKWGECTPEEQSYMKHYADFILTHKFKYLSPEQDALPVNQRDWYFLSYNDIMPSM